MLGAILDRLLQRALRRIMRFPEQRGEQAGATTRAVAQYFSMGATAIFRALPAEEVAAVEREVPWHRRLFFWEGFAFALAGRHACGLRGGNPDQRRLVSHYRAMHYTGYGFWNGLARIYHLPRISLREAHWAGVDDFSRMSPLIGGGFGFIVTMSAGALNEAALETLRSWTSAGTARNAIHGGARALWFVYMDNVQRLESVFSAHLDIKDDLIEAVGMAIGFTHLAAPLRILETVEQFSAAVRPGLIRGVGTALYQSVEEDPELKDRILSIQEPPLRHAYDVCDRLAQRVRPGPTWYSDWETLLRLALP